MKQFIRFLGSGRLAIVLLCLLALLASLGALYPQEPLVGVEAVSLWQNQHPLATTLGSWLGVFHIFHAPVFLVVAGLLLLNTFTCTVVTVTAPRFSFSGTRGIRNTGFLVLHAGLLVLGTGGLISAGFRLDGFVVLIEGQTFQESQQGYHRLYKSPFRNQPHLGYSLRLNDVRVDTEASREVMVTSNLDLRMTEQSERVSVTVSVNRPAAFAGVHLTQDRTGYAPFLRIMSRVTGRPMVGGYVALQRFDTPDGLVHRDQLRLMTGDIVTVTLFPDEKSNGKGNLVSIALGDGEQPSEMELREGESGRLDRFIIAYDNTRRWSAFRIMEDPGYPVVLWGLWISLAGFVLRYLQDIVDWLIKTDPVGTGGSDGTA